MKKNRKPRFPRVPVPCRGWLLLLAATLLNSRSLADYHEINPHFTPNPPSSASGPVDYWYEFSGLSYHTHACNGMVKVQVYGRTSQQGTVGGTKVCDNGEGEIVNDIVALDH